MAQNQAMYDGAIGARGMLQLQNYREPKLAYDGNAYTMAASYCDGQLKIYATHPRESTMGETEYCMTQVNSYAMTGNENGFRQGAAAYRNARDWTQRQRDEFIGKANAAALRISADGDLVSQTESNAKASSLAAGGSFSSRRHLRTSLRLATELLRSDKGQRCHDKLVGAVGHPQCLAHSL